MGKLTKYEMETVVNYNATEQTATVYTRDKSVMHGWIGLWLITLTLTS